jgi:hypothetical protein
MSSRGTADSPLRPLKSTCGMLGHVGDAPHIYIYDIKARQTAVKRDWFFLLTAGTIGAIDILINILS